MDTLHRRRRACSRCRPRPKRRAFTLVELLVALVVLDLGILALVAASAAAARVESATRGDAGMQAAASARMERMLASPCRGAAAATSASAPNLVEWWSDNPAPNGTRELSDSLVLSGPRGPRVLVVQTAGRC